MSTPRIFGDYESKWQKDWDEQGLYHAAQPGVLEAGEKFYGLVEFPFPSGAGLHVGHPRSYVAIDVVTRKKRMEGKNVLFPMGWDAFGLPTENYAIKNHVKPQDATTANVNNFRRQLKSIGFGFDWEREVNTTDPTYYKWTQWMFLQFFKSYFDESTGRARFVEDREAPVKGRGERGEGSGDTLPTTHYPLPSARMAYKTTTTINWCPSCKIGLANEEAIGGVCERCGSAVEKREKAQWMIRITKYAERLINDLSKVNYLERIKKQQIDWIGKSEGAMVDFKVVDRQEVVRVFTTRVDTLCSGTYIILAPEHVFVQKWLEEGCIVNSEEVRTYRKASAAKSDIERQGDKEKAGVELKGLSVLNPVTNESMPIWISDFVFADYGTGAVFADAHDERDFEMAKKFNIPLKVSIRPKDDAQWERVQKLEECYTEDGILVHSGIFDGLTSAEARVKIVDWLTQQGVGSRTTNYKLRDWIFSRQRYWGEPIPIVICSSCGYVPVPEEQLPVLLPDVESYEPTENGESPLAKMREWVETTCPHCGGKAERETDTMPNWAGSSWYFMRYCDPHNDRAFASEEALKYWMPVNLYNGGMEHTTLHLLYSRFWHKMMWDLTLLPESIGSEPYASRVSHGLILAQGGEKMSKSKGNVVNPDDVINEYGADVFRVYMMFIGPFDQPAPWDVKGIEGVKRFLDKVWRLFEDWSTVDGRRSTVDASGPSADLETIYHQSIKKISGDIETLAFNTAVSQLMVLTNTFVDAGGVPEEMVEGYLKILAPFAPHLAEEVWHTLGKGGSVHMSGWPTYDEAKTISASFELVIQINGKVRDRIQVASDISEDEAKVKALASESVQKYLEGKEPKKIMYVKGKLVTIAI